MAKRKKTPDILADLQQDPQTPSVLPQEESPPLQFSANVKLSVTAPEHMKEEIENLVTRELHSLSDVRVVEKEAEWELIILGVELQTKRGEAYGVAFSVVVLQPRRFVHSARRRSLRSPQGSGFDTEPSRFSDFRGVWLHVETKEHLQQLCQGIVADFNSKYLAEWRAAHQQLAET
jgi:hypothetical protein